MRDIDKTSMGQRIKRIRTHAGLRQWELARELGTTQSAVHKYEHGVVPEPRRLLRLAQIGSTSIEWILTGRHWEDGSEERERLTPELMRIASVLRDIEAVERASVDEALQIVREAVRALEGNGDTLVSRDAALAAQTEDTLRLLDQASRIRRAVLHRVALATSERLGASPLSGPEAAATEDEEPTPPR
jgi:transcriptional regulator with XRE-family HTH domain